MDKIIDLLSNIRIIPVVVIDNLDDALPVATALKNGGIPCMEITFRTPVAKMVIEKIIAHDPDLIIGAGTVITKKQAEEAVSAGASFIVSPGINADVIQYCLDINMPVFPGCESASEIMYAMNSGLSVVKFFPAEASGGIKKLTALAAPFKNMKYIPTGGINANNVLSYLSCDNVLCCGGSWMVKGDWVKNQRFDLIEHAAKEAKQIVETGGKND